MARGRSLQGAVGATGAEGQQEGLAEGMVGDSQERRESGVAAREQDGRGTRAKNDEYSMDLECVRGGGRITAERQDELRNKIVLH